MGLGGVSFWQLLIVFGIVILIFGTSRLKGIGSDLGGAIKGFRKAMDSDESARSSTSEDKEEARRIEAGGQPDAEFSEQKEKEKQN
jgi:sec-independent protein translocase protein TatA